jgi:hypothetical protein
MFLVLLGQRSTFRKSYFSDAERLSRNQSKQGQEEGRNPVERQRPFVFCCHLLDYHILCFSPFSASLTGKTRDQYPPNSLHNYMIILNVF